MDVLVSMAVLAILIGLLLPTLSGVQESARRVACRSNVRQIGLGLVMYANDHEGRLPPSIFLDERLFHPNPDVRIQGEEISQLTRMNSIRITGTGAQAGGWDGLGLVYYLDYLGIPKVFYCPSHTGTNPFHRYATAWYEPGVEVVGNYHYRGFGPVPGGRFTNQLYMIEPPTAAIISDGLQDRSENNHKVGMNIFRADLSAQWYSDPAQELGAILPADKEATASNNTAVAQVWRHFDVIPEDPTPR